jgi:anti-sigma factor RsiW
MNHDQIQEALTALYDGELPGNRQKDIQDHLASCPDCQTAWEFWRRTSSALFRPPTFGASEAFVQRVMGRLPADVEEESAAWTWGQWLTPAFGLGLAAFLFVNFLSQQKSQLAAESLLVAGLPAASDSVMTEATPMDGLLGLPADNG